jgi:hypothetical protein
MAANRQRQFHGMNYREVQIINSNNRTKLNREDLIFLKNNGYKNVGWNNLINLFEKLEEILDRYNLKNWTLEELFLEADRIGNKYLTKDEREEFDRQLSKEVNKIAEEIDRQFPDRETEIIDFGVNNQKKYNQLNKKIKHQ